MKVIIALIFIAALLSPMTTARAGLTQSDLASVSLSPPPDAAVPLQLEFRDLGDKRITLEKAIDGHPSLLLFVDYTCRTICGPALAIASGALSQSGLDPTTDYRLIVAGLDPKDTLDDARAMAQQIGDLRIDRATILLRGDAENLRQLAAALGYRYQYDGAIDQFAHPASAIVLTRAGRVSRVLSSLALNPRDLGLALVEAGEGRTGSIGDRLTLRCYGFDAMRGVYTLAIARTLQLLAIATVFGLLAFLIFLRRRRKQIVPGSAT
jgi:protein SCO1/2